MKINEALKKERLQRNLKQKDMIKNLSISKSHYSLIEKGKHRIYADDLMRMLANNKIDYHIFFKEIAADYGYSDNLPVLIQKLDYAFYMNDIKTVKQIKKEIQNIDFAPVELKYHIVLIEAELNHKALKPEMCKKLVKEIFSEDNWTSSRDALRLFGNSMKYLDKHVRKILMSSVLKKYKKITDFNEAEQKRIIGICLNYLFNYDQKTLDRNVTDIFRLIDSVKSVPDYSLYKIVETYYKAKFSENTDVMVMIKNVLEISGYKNISSKLV